MSFVNMISWFNSLKVIMVLDLGIFTNFDKSYKKTIIHDIASLRTHIIKSLVLFWLLPYGFSTFNYNLEMNYSMRHKSLYLVSIYNYFLSKFGGDMFGSPCSLDIVLKLLL